MSKFNFKLNNITISVEANNIDDAKTSVDGLTIDISKFDLQEQRTALYEIPGSCGTE